MRAGHIAGLDFDAVFYQTVLQLLVGGVSSLQESPIAGLTQFSQLALYDGGANVTVAFGADAVTFYGVTQAQLEANSGDFLFV